MIPRACHVVVLLVFFLPGVERPEKGYVFHVLFAVPV